MVTAGRCLDPWSLCREQGVIEMAGTAVGWATWLYGGSLAIQVMFKQYKKG